MENYIFIMIEEKAMVMVFVRIAGDLVQKVFRKVPDHDACVRICKEEGFDASFKWTNGWLDYINVYHWKETLRSWMTKHYALFMTHMVLRMSSRSLAIKLPSFKKEKIQLILTNCDERGNRC